MRKLKTYYILLLMVCPYLSWAQLEQTGISRPAIQKKSAAKIKEVTLSLPFWDDFSFTKTGLASDSLWLNYDQVLVSSGQAFEPPTTNVATFDGLDENGIPYSPSPTDILDFGYRDTLESHKIKMFTDVPVAQRNSVYFSFFFQGGGNSEPPDPNDFLVLQFKSFVRGWVDVVTLHGEDAPDPTVFYDTLIQINDNEYFHDDFQFRFVSFGRKSGRYDGWHLDYMYLNKGRTVSEPSYPDRSAYTRLSPLFNNYYSMPVKHFMADINSNIDLPSYRLRNLENDQQPMNYSVEENTRSYEDGILSIQNVPLQTATPLDPGIQAYEKRIITLEALPDLSGLSTADSIFVDLMVMLETGDDVNTGFEPINFMTNDTITQSYRLIDYYAYDDGEAEFAAGLTTAGNHLAYQYIMESPGPDNIVNGLYIYFPYFAGTPASSMSVSILSKLGDGSDGLLFDQSISITQTANSKFARIDFENGQGVVVPDTFYISYIEPVSGRVRIGLDKSNDTGGKMYYRLTDTSPWQLNDRVTGSLMIRPRFGPGDIISGIPEERDPVSVYPNPNAGAFYLKGPVEQVYVSTITGQSVSFTVEDFFDEKKINLPSAQRGIYIVRYRSSGRIFTKKVLVTH